MSGYAVAHHVELRHRRYDSNTATDAARVEANPRPDRADCAGVDRATPSRPSTASTVGEAL